ncbi:putative nucleoside deaminase [Golden Marseillevirus]|uniref:putative nucleoside deaminase n=1 Tax=Golden Marseillevirus TaxID=1720526 RepID=UPI000877A905|nr:putative nucleoside deaminase [Golden Marseillevirus]ALX27397.1 putative nucleoside deaminase [Golden Marseillevirus]
MQIPETKKRFFELARQQALKSEMSQKIGCVAVVRGRVVSYGYNRDMDGFVLGKSCRMHAEMCTLKRILKRRDCAQGKGSKA